MSALAIRVDANEMTTRRDAVFRGAVHGDITDQLSDGTTQERSWIAA